MSLDALTPQEIKTEDGHVLTVSISGAQGGWPVFLLHGTPGSRTGPKPRSSVLYRRGIKLICYDRPGYGGSSRRHGRRVVDAAKDVATIAADLGITRFSVVGRSGGGPHALACAAELPHLVHRTAALVSVAPSVPDLDWFDGMTPDNVDTYSAADSDGTRLAETLWEKARRTVRNPQSLLAQLETQMTEADKTATSHVSLQWQLADAYAEALRTGPFGWIDDVFAFRADWGFDLTAIRVPVLLWHGVDDNLAPASHTRWLARAIPGAELQLQASTAHFGAVQILPSMLTWLAAGTSNMLPTAHAGNPLPSLCNRPTGSPVASSRDELVAAGTHPPGSETRLVPR